MQKAEEQSFPLTCGFACLQASPGVPESAKVDPFFISAADFPIFASPNIEPFVPGARRTRGAPRSSRGRCDRESIGPSLKIVWVFQGCSVRSLAPVGPIRNSGKRPTGLIRKTGWDQQEQRFEMCIFLGVSVHRN